MPSMTDRTSLALWSDLRRVQLLESSIDQTRSSTWETTFVIGPRPTDSFIVFISSDVHLGTDEDVGDWPHRVAVTNIDLVGTPSFKDFAEYLGYRKERMLILSGVLRSLDARFHFCAFTNRLTSGMKPRSRIALLFRSEPDAAVFRGILACQA